VRYLLDTDWLIDALADRPRERHALEQLSDDGIGISIICLGELYEGAYGASDPHSRLARYREFVSAFTILPLTDAIMERFAITRAELRRQGGLIPDIDLLVAATALEHGLILLTRNSRHFMRVPNLEIYGRE
jgi:predicted nucleic acid-binding protein